jgi:hypothetical protein
MSFLRRTVLAALVAAVSGCVSLSSVSLTPIPAERSNKVHAETSKFYFLGIGFDNDFVDEVRDDLKDKCKNGKVTGILTKDEWVNYFLFIFASRRIVADGYCVK